MRAMKFALLASLALATASASAMVKDRHHYTYFSDASKTTVVGMTLTTCFATTISDGEVTPYFNKISEECATGGSDFDWEGFYLYCTYFTVGMLCP